MKFSQQLSGIIFWGVHMGFFLNKGLNAHRKWKGGNSRLSKTRNERDFILPETEISKMKCAWVKNKIRTDFPPFLLSLQKSRVWDFISCRRIASPRRFHTFRLSKGWAKSKRKKTCCERPGKNLHENWVSVYFSSLSIGYFLSQSTQIERRLVSRARYFQWPRNRKKNFFLNYFRKNEDHYCGLMDRTRFQLDRTYARQRCFSETRTTSRFPFSRPDFFPLGFLAKWTKGKENVKGSSSGKNPSQVMRLELRIERVRLTLSDWKHK